MMKKEILEQIKSIATLLLENEKDFDTVQVKDQLSHLYDKLCVVEFLEIQLLGGSNASAKASPDTEPSSEFTSDTVQEREAAPIMAEDSLAEDVVSEVNEVAEEEVRKPSEKTEPVEQMQMPLDEEEKLIEASDPVSPEVEEDKTSVIPNVAVSMDFEDQELKPENTISETTSELVKSKPVRVSNELELFASSFQTMPEFERKIPSTPITNEEPRMTEENVEGSKADTPNIEVLKTPTFEAQNPKENTSNSFPLKDKIETPQNTNFNFARPRSLNESINQGIHIGLNDRLAFIKHLFDGHSEDYTRVISQINTMHSFDEAKSFIDEKIKPDYSDWNNKEEIAHRFMSVIERRFI